MPRPEGTPIPTLERENIRIANPVELMRGNPAALIVNKESYDRMAGHFTYGPEGQFESPQVVRVMTFSSEHGQVIREFVLDGMTRTKFVADNQDNPKVISPDFKFTVKDVTASVLLNPEIVLPDERLQGQQALTMLQYLRAVIPPTIEHSQIAPDRIAAHLINGWENMAGEEISRRYSALAALSLLGNLSVNTATDNSLKQALTQQTKLMAGETLTERENLQRSLLEMNKLLRQTGLPRKEVARSAFMLIGGQSQIIGGQKEANRQVYGLLYAPEVNIKLEEAYPDKSICEQMRQQLGEFITRAFSKIDKEPKKEEIINVLGDALRDPNLNFNYVLDVFNADNPIIRYDEVRQNINERKLTANYLAAHKLQVLSPVESQLISTLGGVPILQDLPALVRNIRIAEGAMQRAENFKAQLATKGNELIASGVNPAFLSEATSGLQKAQEAVTTAPLLATLNGKTRELENTINEINGQINRQITRHQVFEMVDQTGGDKLREGYGPQIRLDIIGLVLGEYNSINGGNQAQVGQRIREFLSLDPDLLFRVKNGDIRLALALQRQKEKSQPAILPGAPRAGLPAPANETQPSPPVVTPPRIEPVARPTESPAPRPEEVVIDRQQLEAKRIETNREKLNRILTNLGPLLKDIDLAPHEITGRERSGIDNVIKMLGHLGYHHPNLPHLVTEQYPHLQDEVGRLRAQLFAKEQEQTYSDTRTSR